MKFLNKAMLGYPCYLISNGTFHKQKFDWIITYIIFSYFLSEFAFYNAANKDQLLKKK